MAKITSLNLVLNNGQEVFLRNLNSDDAEAFLVFRNQIPYESTNTMHYIGMQFPTIDDTKKKLLAQSEDENILNIGAFENKLMIGYLNFRVERPDHPWAKHIAQFGMMILKKYWGLGLAKHLLSLQETHAKIHGIIRIEAMVRLGNDRAITLYERCGYNIEGTRKHAAIIDGEVCDEYFIAKILSNNTPKWTPPTIISKRLCIRPINFNDAQSIFEYAKNQNISKYTLWEPHMTLKDSQNFINDYVFHYYNKGVPEPLGITLIESPETVIGTVGCFWVSEKNKTMEAAYALDEKYWGRGIVVEALHEVIRYCFQEFGLNRIQARCKVGNKASAKVMEKVGMTYEGTAKSQIFHKGVYWDMITYGLVKK
ncbi:MAG: GNAT family N-acetyltransferase [Pseudobdellovibrio sp.]